MNKRRTQFFTTKGKGSVVRWFGFAPANTPNTYSHNNAYRYAYNYNNNSKETKKQRSKVRCAPCVRTTSWCLVSSAMVGAMSAAALSMFSMVRRSPRRCSAFPPTAITIRSPFFFFLLPVLPVLVALVAVAVLLLLLYRTADAPVLGAVLLLQAILLLLLQLVGAEGGAIDNVANRRFPPPRMQDVLFAAAANIPDVYL
jgi:hypothetical protein